MEFLLAIVGAFFFYLVILPLFGWLIGLFFRVGLPYAGGGLLIYLLDLHPAWYLLAGVWLLGMLAVRNRIGREQLMDWSEGHYQSAKMLLSLGLMMKNRVEE